MAKALANKVLGEGKYEITAEMKEMCIRDRYYRGYCWFFVHAAAGIYQQRNEF